VASHTGLPSIYSDVPVRVSVGGRVLADGSGPVLVSDALAEPGVATTYTVGDETIALTRRDDGHMLTNARGRHRVELAWLGDDSDEWDPRVSMFDVSGARSPIARWSLRPSTVTGTLQARTVAGQTQALRDLVSADHRGPVIAVHSPGECQIPDCDIPLVRLVVLSSAQSQRSGRVDVAARTWSLPYRGVDPSESRLSGACPVVTWGEWEALGEGWQDRTMLDLCRLVAGMPAAGPAHVLGHADPALLPGSARQGDGWIAADSADWGAVDAGSLHGLVRPVIVLSSMSEVLPGSAAAGDVWMAMDSGDFGRVA
jgi:hypothetical protein